MFSHKFTDFIKNSEMEISTFIIQKNDQSMIPRSIRKIYFPAYYS